MSHSYDQTLIQRLGFSDPDRRLPAHDDACVEIATDPGRFLRGVIERPGITDVRCELEKPLQKGDGKYASTVGFIDAVVTWLEPYNGSDDYDGFSRIKDASGNPLGVLSMLIEVKTKVDGVGNLLRQMNLYRQYMRCFRYVIWSLDPADDRFAKLLAQQGYHLIAGPLSP